MFKKCLILTTILVVAVSVLAGCSAQSSATNEKKGDMAAMNGKSDSPKTQDTSATKVETAANTPQSTNKEQVFEGWLFDKMSFDKTTSDKMPCDKMSSDKMSSDKMSSDKMSSDKMEPEKKTKECLLMPMMEQSGYGVLVKQQDNTFKFYKFDEAGHKLAKETILNKTSKTENIKITVKGVIEGELIKVSSIQEIS